ncbi:hypothetical protein TNCV_2999471 [Trichonephila clavipes]|nr:hypothetical protein TNCV_2999471 [Trichonephila clavipes]
MPCISEKGTELNISPFSIHQVEDCGTPKLQPTTEASMWSSKMMPNLALSPTFHQVSMESSLQCVVCHNRLRGGKLKDSRRDRR